MPSCKIKIFHKIVYIKLTSAVSTVLFQSQCVNDVWILYCYLQGKLQCMRGILRNLSAWGLRKRYTSVYGNPRSLNHRGSHWSWQDCSQSRKTILLQNKDFPQDSVHKINVCALSTVSFQSQCVKDVWILYCYLQGQLQCTRGILGNLSAWGSRKRYTSV